MAWTITRQGCIINLIPDGNNDFVWGTSFPEEPEGINIESIQVYFNAVNDVINIRTHGVTGPSIFKFKTSTGDSVYKKFMGALIKPAIKNSDLTGSSTDWLIIIQTT